MNKRVVQRIVALILGLVLVGGVTSCGGPTTSTPSATTSPTIKILGTMPLSGEAANLGPAYDRAIRMAVDELNEAGIPGFAGIDYKVIDTETKPSTFQKKLEREVQTWHPNLIIGAALETEIRVPCQLSPQYKLPCIVGGHLSMSKYLPPGEVPLSRMGVLLWVFGLLLRMAGRSVFP